MKSKITILLILLQSLMFAQKNGEVKEINGVLKKWNGRSWIASSTSTSTSSSSIPDTASLVVGRNKLSNEYFAKDSTVTKLIAGSNVTVQKQGTSGAWKITATGGGGGGSTDTTSLSDRIDAKQNIIPNLADTSKYVEGKDTTNRWAPKGSYQAPIANLSDTSKYVEGADTTGRWAPKGSYQAPIANLADTAKYLEVSDTTYLLSGKLAGKQATIPNIADTSKYLEKYQRNNGDTTFIAFYGGSDTMRFYVDSTGLIRTPNQGITSFTEKFEDFFAGSATGDLNWTGTNSTGSHGITAGDSTAWGVFQGTTGASATGSSYLSTTVTGFGAGNGTAVFEARVKVNQLQAKGTGGCFKVCIGFGDVVTGAISTDGVWFQYDSISAGKWVAYTKMAGNFDSAGVGSAISNSSWYTLRAEIDGYKGSTLPTVRFYINGALVRTVFSTNKVPFGSALFGAITGITKFTGSNTVAKTYNIDYYYLSKRYGYNIPVKNR
jgi:hypothetical protein